MGAERPRRTLVLARVGALVCLAGFVAAVVVGYSAIREVMVESGGYCASGGPYVVANECGDGIALRIFGSTFAALALGGAAAALNAVGRGPRIGLFFPLGAVFALLGWNFIDLGFGPPPEADAERLWSWVFCGVVFWLIAAAFMAPGVYRFAAWLRRGREPEPPPLDPELVRSVFGARRR